MLEVATVRPPDGVRAHYRGHERRGKVEIEQNGTEQEEAFRLPDETTEARHMPGLR
ncbi:MAG: hypothetical protein U5Q44_11670 [Dehalococcoidia bacterium]|nr:hypothetical protein [Dehalococcoidia bacterium]